MKNSIVSKTLVLGAASLTLFVAACNSPAEEQADMSADKMEDKADTMRDTADIKADALEDKADTMDPRSHTHKRDSQRA